MEKNFRILYIMDPSSGNNREDSVLQKKYNVRTVRSREELFSVSEKFTPHILLCSLESRISSREALDIVGVKDKNAPVIITVVGGDLEKLLPLIESSAHHLQENETGNVKKDKQNELENRHSSVYMTSVDGILVTQPDGTITAANPAACEMLQMTEEEICRAGRAGIVDPEDTRLEVAMGQRKEFGRAHTELRFIKKSGEKFSADLTSSVYKNADGQLLITVILRDITDRKKVEKELRISHESYKTIFYHSPIPYWIYDLDTLEIVDVNEAAQKNYGYTRKEFLKLKLSDLRSKDDVPHLHKYLNNNRDIKGIVRHGKFVHLRKDGTRLRVEVYGYKLDYNRRSCRMVACIDITEKEEAAAEMELKQARLKAAQEMAKIGYWEMNVPSETMFLSEMMCKIWERKKSSFIPTWPFFLQTIHPEDRETFLRAHEDSIHRGKENKVEYRILLPSGKVKWINERGRVLTWKDDDPQTVERTVQDITEEKVYLEKLSTSESRYKGIVQSQTNYLIRTDLQGNYTYYNDKFFSDFGWLYENNEIIGSPSLSSIKEYHHEAVMDLVGRCLIAPGTAFQMEIDKPGKNGSVRTTLWDFICLLDARGNPAEIQCVGTDISGRVKAEKELKDSKLRYQLITEATSDAIWDWDLTTGYLFWGKSFYTMFGHDPEDIETVEVWASLIHPDDNLRIQGELQAAIEGTGKKWQCEYRLKKKSGEYAYVVEKGTFLRDETNIACRLVGALQDITEKKKLEDLLEKANTLSRIGSFEVDLLKKEIYWSPMVREIHEVEKDFTPTIEMGILFFKEGKYRNKIREALRKAIAEKEGYDEELKIITSGGKELWVKIIAEPELEHGKCIRIKGSLQDIDKIKRAEVELKKVAKEKETLLESIGDAFFAVDENWTVTYWNKQAAILLDLAKDKILKKNLWDIFPEAKGTSFQHNYEATMKDRKKRRFEGFFDKTSSWYDVSVYPANEGLSIFFKDVTQRKLAEGRLKELNSSLKAHTRELVTANKGLEQFSYIVSHNLRSPVANILGLADLLQNEDYPSDIREKLFTEVFSNIERLDTVIKDLNSILQVKVDVKAKREKIDLKSLVTEISSSIQNLVGEEKAEIICDFEQMPSIISVRSYLYSIFYNLIVNSIKYKRPDLPPVIEISAVAKGESIIIHFKDNGLGIDVARKNGQIFNLYKRFHHHVEGKGMGLFMVKTQVEMLGGKISLESEVNRGTTFTIVFHKIKPTDIEDETALSLPGG